MIRRTEIPPEITRGDAQTVVITVRHVGDSARRNAAAEAAAAGREQGPWPGGLLSWSLFSSTDGRALMAYEQWADDGFLDVTLTAAVPHVQGILGAEPSAPVRYRVHRSYVSTAQKAPVGCVVTPVFDTDGPERRRHFISEVFAMTEDVATMPGSIAAHVHTSVDGTRVFNYAEWRDEQSHIDAVTGEIPGVRPCGYRRWELHNALVAA
ncbi:antibiotic biosynthesis monooxygenase [Streptomyces sp. MNU76]|uniref:antibiotic biosynthesis monooxygenase n=1 Tax=Streptomyces sp. MNU76 TaxID=2560026 RepID=UPI001E476138|nr:antibiotic biosynthesis monooxygenase [Streptomyces sp. MNU76]MCC9710666.1 antibiotic biosynthesis monooxygenase [Streptomyces sp. MNU76]